MLQMGRNHLEIRLKEFFENNAKILLLDSCTVNQHFST